MTHPIGHLGLRIVSNVRCKTVPSSLSVPKVLQSTGTLHMLEIFQYSDVASDGT